MAQCEEADAGIDQRSEEKVSPMKRLYELELREEAEEDVAASVVWYSENHPSRVQRFLEALEECLSFISRTSNYPGDPGGRDQATPATFLSIVCGVYDR